MIKKNRKQLKKGRKKLLINLLIYFLFLCGVLIMLYPFYISALNNYLDNVRASNYAKELKQNFEGQQKKLQAKNKELAKQGLTPATDPFNEQATNLVSKDYYKAHLLGSISIPKINLKIPLFDKTNNDLLEIGATVLDGTSYPLGGENTHSVISAHRGLPNRELFTDLPKLNQGDIFVLEVLGQKLAYQVTKIETVTPNQTDVLKIESGKDLVTLLTCTPYMINSHRLLVTGTRVPYIENVQKKVNQSDNNRTLIQIIMLVCLVIFILLMLWLLYRLIYHYLLAKESFKLQLRVLDENDMAAIQSLFLYSNNGKKAMKRQGKPIELTPDSLGNYEIDNLPKMLYCLKTGDNALIIIVGQNKLHQKDLVIKQSKHSIKSFEVIGENIIRLH